MAGEAPVLARHVAPPARIDWPAMFGSGKYDLSQFMNQERVGERPLLVSHSSGCRGKVESREAR